MKKPVMILPVLLVLAVFFAGCTTQPGPATTPAPAATPAATQPAGTPAVAARSLTGTAWKLGWYDDTKGVWSSVIQGSTIMATFTQGGTIDGSNGCTPYTTEYQLIGTSGAISIRRPAVPATTCSEPTGVMNQQSAYYTDLMWSEKFVIENNQLRMFDRTGKKILQFDSMP